MKVQKRQSRSVARPVDKLDSFLNQFLATAEIPQTGVFMYEDTYKITIQYIPNKGFGVGYEDKRVSSNNLIMVWADIVLLQAKPLTEDNFRDLVMNTNQLPENTLGKKNNRLLTGRAQLPAERTASEFQKPVDKGGTKEELKIAISDVGTQAKEMYLMNSRMYLPKNKSKNYLR